jgi:hypothetical protein
LLRQWIIRAALLLDDVGQLMGQEQLARDVAGLITTLPENYVLPYGVSPCVNGVRRVSCLRVVMNTHAAEVVAETRFHLLARRRLKRLPA